MYEKQKQIGNYGISYSYDPSCYPTHLYYQTSEERDGMFETILTTGQVHCEERNCMLSPYRMYKVERSEEVYRLKERK